MKAQHQFPLYAVNNNDHRFVIFQHVLSAALPEHMFAKSLANAGYIIDQVLVYKLAISHNTIHSYEDFVNAINNTIEVYDAFDNTYEYGKKLNTYEIYELWLNYRELKNSGSIKIELDTNTSRRMYPTPHTDYTVHSSGNRILKRQQFQKEWHTSKLPVRHRNRKIFLKDEEISRRSIGWKDHKKKHQWE